MNKLFLTLLLTAITVTSIKPAEQPQPNNSWLRTACIAGAGLISMGLYGYMTGKRGKKKRLAGHILGPAQPGQLPEIPAAGRWDIEETTNQLVRIAPSISNSMMCGLLIGTSIGAFLVYKDGKRINPVNICLSIAAVNLLRTAALTSIVILKSDFVQEFAKKRHDTFKYQYIKANPDTYEQQCRLNYSFEKAKPLVEQAREENEQERQAAYPIAVAEQKAEVGKHFIPGLANIINGYADIPEAAPANWKIGDPIS